MNERNRPQASSTDRERLDAALMQIVEAATVYDQAIASYNEHLENHRDRRDLHDLTRRQPVADMERFQSAIDGNREAIEAILSAMFDQSQLDSSVRCHPRVYPIHLEAVEHLEIARDQLVRALEGALRCLHRVNGDSTQQLS